MTATLRKPASKRARTVWRVTREGLAPFDSATGAMLRGKGYKLGDVVSADLRKPRNPKFNSLAHKFGEMLADNIEAFEGVDPHTVLKRLQLEANIGCDEIALNFPGIGPCSYRIPQSLSFESMDEATFSTVYAAMCAYVARVYWPSMTAEAIAEAGAFYEGQR